MDDLMMFGHMVGILAAAARNLDEGFRRCYTSTEGSPALRNSVPALDGLRERFFQTQIGVMDLIEDVARVERQLHEGVNYGQPRSDPPAVDPGGEQHPGRGAG
jgi:hypothetical protein